MNIFYLDKNPAKCAEYHCDQHCVKMIIEYAQLMSTAHRLLDGDDDRFYKKTHMNHPSAIWTRASQANYEYLYKLFCALCDEFKVRYGKPHLTDIKMRGVLKSPPVNIPNEPFIEPPLAMPDHCKLEDAVDSYRNLYKVEKVKFAKWRNKKPDWMN